MGLKMKNKFHCLDCNKLISTKNTKRCSSCHFKNVWKLGSFKKRPIGNKHHLWKGGKPNCKDCGKILSNRDHVRCRSCRTKLLHKQGLINMSGLHHTGEKSSNWQGGKSFKPYTPEFNFLLKQYILKRDKYTCQLCHKRGNQIHHIDYNKENCQKNNLITLCRKCHAKTNFIRDAWYSLFISKKYKIRQTPSIIYTPGSWDMLHIGHVNIFLKAKSLGDYLIVGVSTNTLIKSYKNTPPIISYNDRVAVIKALKCVDKVIKQKKFFDIKQLKSFHINTIVLGSDWSNKPFPELYNVTKTLNIQLKFLPYTNHLSSSKIKEKIINNAVKIIKSQVGRT